MNKLLIFQKKLIPIEFPPNFLRPFLRSLTTSVISYFTAGYFTMLGWIYFSEIGYIHADDASLIFFIVGGTVGGVISAYFELRK